MKTRSAPALLPLLLGAGASFAACGPVPDVSMPPPRGDVPALVVPAPGRAVIAGRVVDLDGQPVAAARITAAEIDKQVTADGDGRFQIEIPAASTITLQATAAGFAPTFAASLEVPSERTAGDVELYLVPPAKLEELNLGTRMPAALGVVAVELRSKDGRCTPTGGQVMLTPAGLGTVLYTEGASHQPDPTLAVAAAVDGISAWIIGALPAGGASTLAAHKEGCADVAFPVDLGDRVHTGKFRIAPGALTQIVLFVE